jgi:hypothetical protein
MKTPGSRHLQAVAPLVGNAAIIGTKSNEISHAEMPSGLHNGTRRNKVRARRLRSGIMQSAYRMARGSSLSSSWCISSSATADFAPSCLKDSSASQDRIFLFLGYACNCQWISFQEDQVPLKITTSTSTSFYSSLQDSDEIRLLHLQPGSGTEEMKCSIEHVKFSSNPQYKALSYMWGPENPVQSIVINETDCAVRENLGLALQHLRLENETRILWIDAICLYVDRSIRKEIPQELEVWTSVFWGLLFGKPDLVRSSH